MSKLMQIDHADRALANARDAETSDTVDSRAVGISAWTDAEDSRWFCCKLSGVGGNC